MINKVKNRYRVLILTNTTKVKRDFSLLLSSHGYLVDIVTTFSEAEEKLTQYKPSIFLSEITLLPTNPLEVTSVFKRIKKIPVFLVIDFGDAHKKIKRYIEHDIDDILLFPYDANTLYYKIKRAASYNRMQHEIAYHSGMIFILKFMLPIFLLIVYLITTIY